MRAAGREHRYVQIGSRGRWAFAAAAGDFPSGALQWSNL